MKHKNVDEVKCDVNRIINLLVYQCGGNKIDSKTKQMKHTFNVHFKCKHLLTFSLRSFDMNMQFLEQFYCMGSCCAGVHCTVYKNSTIDCTFEPFTIKLHTYSRFGMLEQTENKRPFNADTLNALLVCNQDEHLFRKYISTLCNRFGEKNMCQQ